MDKYIEYFKELSPMTKAFLMFTFGCATIALLDVGTGLLIFGGGLIIAALVAALNQAMN